MSNWQENQVRFIRWFDWNEWGCKEFTYNEDTWVLTVPKINAQIETPAWTISSDEIDSAVIQVKKTTITSDQIKALFTTPISIVPAPWAWKVVQICSITATMTYVSSAYATQTTLEFRHTNWAWSKVSADIASLLNATATKVQSVEWIEAEHTLTVNAPIVACVPTANPTAWDSDIKVTVAYRIITL